MNARRTAIAGVLSFAVSFTGFATAGAQGGAETFTATATVKTAGAASASAPVTIVVDRKMPQAEADKLIAAFKAGGTSELRKALEGVPPTGSVQLAAGAPVATRITVERTTDKGRLLTIVADQPILFLGTGLPDAKPKAGHNYAVIDLEVDASGNGSGTFAPAAKVTVKQGAFVVEDYASELVQLTSVKKVK